MRIKPYTYIILMLFIFFLSPSELYPQNKKDLLPKASPQKLALVCATMCEGMDGLLPFNKAIIFSINKGKVYCFTSFNPVLEKTFILHNWYYRDKLITRIKLHIKPPRWSTYSSIKFREADKGPWRVEVTDKNGNILKTLRFSITD
ncbi:MAG: hypothetical protein B1H11_03400 [Desulfobacteraceae bacterium 4484_190.1]|nr:MAG: hypothetical protein B1H11_03400 [Desulfobacteraceae bacterium 4484_190.1]